jgi:hypothetical protein
MVKTIDKAEKTVRDARDTVSTGVDETRRTAADILDTVGENVRRQSRRASRVTEKTGRRIGDTLEMSAERMRGHQSRSFFGYFRRHPMRVFLMLGLMTGVLALIAVPMLAKQRVTDEEFEGVGPF